MEGYWIEFEKLYQTLGVTYNASSGDINRIYNRQATIFNQVRHSYLILSDPIKRAMCDILITTPINDREKVSINLRAIIHLFNKLLDNDSSSKQSCLVQRETLRGFVHMLEREQLNPDIFDSQGLKEFVNCIIRVGSINEHIDFRYDYNFEESIWWACKKLSLRILFLLYSNIIKSSDILSSDKAKLEESLEDGIKNVSLLIRSRCQSKWSLITERVQTYLSNTIWSLDEERRVEVGTKERLLRETLLPMMLHTKAEEEFYNSDPVRYVRNKFAEENPSSTFVGGMACRLLIDLCRNDGELLKKISDHTLEVLSYPEQGDQELEGALYVLGSLIYGLKNQPPIKSRFEFIMMHRFNELLQSKNLFLRARAFWLFAAFDGLKMVTDAPIESVCQSGWVHLMSKEDEWCVRVEALLGWREPILNKDSLLESGYVTSVVLELLELISFSWSLDAAQLLKSIIHVHQETLVGILNDIADSMAKTLNDILDKTSEEQSTANGFLLIFTEIFKSINQQHWYKFETSLVNIIKTIIERKSKSNQTIHGLNLLAMISNYAIETGSWDLYAPICAEINPEDIPEINENLFIIEAISRLLYTYIANNKEFFISEREIESLIDKFVFIIDPKNPKLAGNDHLLNRDSLVKVRVAILALIEHTILQFQCSQPDTLLFKAKLPIIVEIVLDCISCDDFAFVKLRNELLNVLFALYYSDSEALINTFQTINPEKSSTMFSLFVKTWLDSLDGPKTIHDIKMRLLGFISVITSQAKICNWPNYGPRYPEIPFNILLPQVLKLCDRLEKSRDHIPERCQRQMIGFDYKAIIDCKDSCHYVDEFNSLKRAIEEAQVEQDLYERLVAPLDDTQREKLDQFCA